MILTMSLLGCAALFLWFEFLATQMVHAIADENHCSGVNAKQ